jgi:hypothetical protein
VQQLGVHSDTGTIFRGPGYASSTRPTALDMSVVRRELEIIRDHLHANAVCIGGSYIGRMTAVTEVALGLGVGSGSLRTTPPGGRAGAPLWQGLSRYGYPLTPPPLSGRLSLKFKTPSLGRTGRDREPHRAMAHYVDDHLARLFDSLSAIAIVGTCVNAEGNSGA